MRRYLCIELVVLKEKSSPSSDFITGYCHVYHTSVKVVSYVIDLRLGKKQKLWGVRFRSDYFIVLYSYSVIKCA